MRNDMYIGISFTTELFYVNFRRSILQCNPYAYTYLVLVVISPVWSALFYAQTCGLAYELRPDMPIQKLISLCLT